MVVVVAVAVVVVVAWLLFVLAVVAGVPYQHLTLPTIVRLYSLGSVGVVTK